MAAGPSGDGTKSNPLKEITQPFVDLFQAPRALWGVNLSYFSNSSRILPVFLGPGYR